ncbi:MAG: class I SAM-dependent methyltransferase, partial [Desertimonas sp.]
PGESMLDVGCGDGVLWRRLDDAGAAPRTYLGVDISAAAIETAPQRGAGVEFRALDYDTAADQIEDRFDVVVFNESLAYFRSPAGTLQQAFDRHLRPGGVVLVSLWDQPAYGDDALWRRLLAGRQVVAESERRHPVHGSRWRAKALAT